jgi:histone H3/H4
MNGPSRFKEPDVSGIRRQIVPETRPLANPPKEPSKTIMDERRKPIPGENYEKQVSNNPFISKEGPYIPSFQDLPARSNQQVAGSSQRPNEPRAGPQSSSSKINPEKQAVNQGQKKEADNFSELFTKMSKDPTAVEQNSKGKPLESRFRDPLPEVQINSSQPSGSLKRPAPDSDVEPMVKKTVKMNPNPKPKVEKKRGTGMSEQKDRKEPNASKVNQSGYENSILGRVIPKTAFEALVKEVTKEGIGEMKFQKKAYSVIQMGCENFLEREFRAANRITRARGRATLMTKDMVAVAQVVEDLGFKRAVSCPH